MATRTRTVDSKAASNGDKGEKLGAVVARQIEMDILAQGLTTGDLVGVEAELVDRFSVSKAVLREAIRLLEHRQVVAMRRGFGGGLVVKGTPAETIVEAISIYLDFVEMTAEELFEARQALEQVAARLAAERITEPEVHALRSSLAEEHAGQLSAARDFHVILADASGNPPLALFVKALITATEYRVNTTGISKKARVESMRDHEAIVEAVASGKAGLAEHAMAQHMSGTGWIQGLTRAIIRSDAATTAMARWTEAKVPERLAHQLKIDIVQRGWPLGEVLGSEAELLAKYRVSREALREAVRILEYYGVARMRRGPGGGLIVGQPDLARIVEVVTFYLEHLRTGMDELHEARDAIELTSVELATKRLTDAGAEQLQETLQVEARMTPDQTNDVSHQLHLLVAQLGANRALEFFTHVVTNLAARHVPDRRRLAARDAARMAEDVQRTHVLIVEAVLSGDPVTARRRMQRHLDALTPYIDLKRPTGTRRSVR